MSMELGHSQDVERADTGLREMLGFGGSTGGAVTRLDYDADAIVGAGSAWLRCRRLTRLFDATIAWRDPAAHRAGATWRRKCLARLNMSWT